MIPYKATVGDSKMKRKKLLIIFFSILVLFSFVLLWLFNKSGMPSIVGTSTTVATITTNFQRKSFYANGYHWIFYCNGSHILYTASSDGSNWKTPTVVRADISSSSMSVWYDGNVHYAYASHNNPVIYRRGSIYGDRIEWEAERIAVPAVPGLTCTNGYTLIDSDGYPWVAYMQYDDLYWVGRVAKATARDGSTWAAPHRIFESTTPYMPTWRISVLPLENGKLLAIYTSTIGVKAKLWNGSAWGTEENVTAAHLAQDYGFSAVSYNNDVQLALLEDETYNILYFKRTIGTGWNQEEIIQRNQSSLSFPVLCIDEPTRNLYCFWTYKNAVYMKKYVSGIWKDSSSSPFGTTSNTLRSISCFYKTWNRKVGVAWLEKLGMSSFRLKYQFLDVSVTT